MTIPDNQDTCRYPPWCVGDSNPRTRKELIYSQPQLPLCERTIYYLLFSNSYPLQTWIHSRVFDMWWYRADSPDRTDNLWGFNSALLPIELWRQMTLTFLLRKSTDKIMEGNIVPMWMLQAVNEGFEPPVDFPTPVFKTGTINQTLPINHVYLLHFQFTIIVICIFPATAR